MAGTFLPYKQLMSPKWIEKNAIITGPYTVTNDYYEITSTSGATNQRALRVQIVPPHILTSTDSYTVTVLVAMDTSIAVTNDHDPIFGISDMKNFMGLETNDVQNYKTNGPCTSVQADVGASQLQNTIYGKSPIVDSSHYSSEVTARIRPSEQWGSCHTEHNEGYTVAVNYGNSLDPWDGLYFEFYRNHAIEEYRIKYMEVTVECS